MQVDKKRIRRLVRDLLPLLVSSIFLLCLLVYYVFRTMQLNEGHLVYTLDDPYIHMAMAKNLALHGVFGVTRLAFSSSTSSPLWTLLLALVYRLFGVSNWMPGLLAAIFGLGSIFIADSLCKLFKMEYISRLVTCAMIVYLTPMLAVISTGMEHTLHVFLTLLLMRSFFVYLETKRNQDFLIVCISAILAVGTRYESLFIVAPFCLWLLTAGDWYKAVLLGGVSMLPVGAFGFFSLSQGSYILPNSLMLKGRFPATDGLRAVVDS